MSEFTLKPLYDYPQRERVLTLAAEHAVAVDKNERSPFEVLRELGAEGLLTLGRGISQGTEHNGVSLLPQVAVAFDLATECASTAFSLWAHRSTIAFFDAVGRPLPEGLAEGNVTGTTAMAAAYKDASGLAPIPVKATRVEGGLNLNGTVSWASNLYPHGVIVLPVAVEGIEGDNRRIVTVNRDADGLHVHYHRNLLALGSTESGTIRFENVFIPESDILTEDFPGFLAAVTAPFLLVQSSFCLGLGAGALKSAAAHREVSGGVFLADYDTLTAEYERLRVEITRLAQDPAAAARADLLQLRLDVSHFATSAAHYELAVVGGAGYDATSATARRLREASFLPVQSPTEGHLRYELSRIEQH